MKPTKTSLKDFAALILTHGRPDRVFTYDTLRRSGYTGRIVIVVDNEDTAGQQYREKYGDQVVVFNKAKAAKITDPGDNFGGTNGVVFARNASFEIARKLEIKYFIMLDDDYRHFQFRFDHKLGYRPRVCKQLDRVFAAMLRFYIDSGYTAVSMAQGGDFIGGEACQNAQSIRASRKAMNSFVCSPDRPFKFMGRLNEDVNAYMRPASVGALFLTTNQLSLEQTQTQSNAGGLTEMYLDLGTYVKSFYSVLYHPSSVKVAMLRDRSARLHHKVSWKHTTPKIIPESFRKGYSERKKIAK